MDKRSSYGNCIENAFSGAQGTEILGLLKNKTIPARAAIDGLAEDIFRELENLGIDLTGRNDIEQDRNAENLEHDLEEALQTLLAKKLKRISSGLQQSLDELISDVADEVSMRAEIKLTDSPEYTPPKDAGEERKPIDFREMTKGRRKALQIKRQ